MTTHGRPRATRPAGFTLVELLVVIAIIGTLLALLLPAVQMAREAGRRTACSNNLHQIGIGMTSYHDALGAFPAGCVEPVSKKRPKGRQLAWSAYLLPFIEQQSLYDRIDLSKTYNSKENAKAAAEVVQAYVCPSVPHPTLLRSGRGVCDYGGIYGQRIRGANNPPNGVMLYDRAISMREIPDGLSHTLVISEDSLFDDGQWINGLNIFDVSCAVNKAPPFENDIRSKHPRGANGLMADGSVQFLREDLDLKVLAALCTRNGGEIVSEF
jgi:prepilin-type N-terminal cleavage/methylation domain-containing protein/prepilin-type processing-associated H-X9-DG protein